MIITRGLGKENKLITRGYGPELVIIIDNRPRGGGNVYRDPKLIQTKKIRLYPYDKDLEVKVLFMNESDLNRVEVVVEELGFESYEIHFIEDVILLD